MDLYFVDFFEFDFLLCVVGYDYYIMKFIVFFIWQYI